MSRFSFTRAVQGVRRSPGAGKKGSSLLAGPLVRLVLALGLGLTLAWGHTHLQPRPAPGTYPEPYRHTFTASGLIERVRYVGLRNRACELEVATYAWINLSSGFPLGAAPQEGERYTLYAPRDWCVAAEVAAAATDGHIVFRAGAGAAARWYLSARPEPALGCGGLIDWQPPPRPETPGAFAFLYKRRLWAEAHGH